ncbi:MAG TPA: hypothetical protein VH475_08335, partial [Tepidisphaeraceae bacterium]
MSTDISVASNSATSPAAAPPNAPVVHGQIPPKSNGAPTSSGNGLVEAAPPGKWTPADSARVYGIDYWGQGYFSV